MRNRVALRVRDDHPFGFDSPPRVPQPRDLRCESLEVSFGRGGSDALTELFDDTADGI